MIAGSAAGPPSNRADVCPDDLLPLLWRSRRWALIAVIVGAIGGLAWSLPQPPIYRAHAALEVLDRDRDFLGASGVSPTRTGGPAASRAGLATHAQILGSRGLTAKAFAKLRNGRSAGITDEQERPLAESLLVTTPGETFILEMQADSTDPRLAAAYLDTLAEVYIEENLKSRWNAVHETETWLERQLTDLREKLENSQGKLQQYARQSGLLFVNSDETVAEQRLRQLQGELSEAEADRIAKQSGFELIEQGAGTALPESPQVLNLRAYERRLTELRTELAELDATFTPAHPKVKRVVAQIAEMEAAVTQERAVLMEQASDDYQAAVRRQDLLSTTYDRQARLVSDHAVKSIHYDILRREVDTNQQMYDALLRRVKETAVASALNAGNVRVVDRAQVPAEPIGPNHVLHGVMGGMLGGFIGLLAVMVRARVDSKLRVPADVAYWMRSPELGVVPAADAGVSHRALRGRSLRLRVRYSRGRDGGLALRRPSQRRLPPPGPFQIERLAEASDFSPMAEGVRAALTSVLFAGNGRNPHTVLAVTSPSPEDGKTTIACNLAISLARIGKKTLLIDADFRRPRLHEVFGVSNEEGLTGLLRRTGGERMSGLREAVQTTSIDGLFVLPSGPMDALASREIYSKRLPLLLEVLRNEYPVILIDTPPMMQIADARVLAQLADAAVLVVRAGRTTRAAARDAEERLTRDGTRVLGVVLNGWMPEGGVDRYYAYPPAAATDNGRSMAASA